MTALISKIRTDYVYPPGRRHQNDWVAWLDGEDGPYGVGPTEDAAIEELYALIAIRDECNESH